MTRGERLLLSLLGAAACGDGGAGSRTIPGDAGPAIVVEVLNASGRDGDARAGTRVLRRAGIDVVYFGNAAELHDSTRILVRRGDGRAARRVRAVLGIGRVIMAPDTGRLLDASVLLGADFRPPPSW